MIIRNAEKKDIERILEVFASAKAYMRKNGNTKQWADSYPDTETILEDIKEKQFYVMEEDNCIHGVFAFIIGEDPTYRIIENGEWKSDTLYGTCLLYTSLLEKKTIQGYNVQVCNSIHISVAVFQQVPR